MMSRRMFAVIVIGLGVGATLTCVATEARAKGETQALLGELDRAANIAKRREKQEQEIDALVEKVVKGVATPGIEKKIADKRRLLDETNKTFDAQMAAVNKAAKAYNQANQWRKPLFEKAIKTIDGLRFTTVNVHPSNRARAIAAIQRDLPQVQMSRLGRLADMINVAEELAKAGKPLDYIKGKLAEMAGNEVDKEAADLVLGKLKDLAEAKMKLPEDGIIKKLEGKADYVGKGLKLMRVLRGEAKQPLKTAEISEMVNLLDFGSDFVPSGAKATSGYLIWAKGLLEKADEMWSDALVKISSHNLDVLYMLVINDRSTRIKGTDWSGLAERDALFGHIAAEPKVTLDRSNYIPNSTIKVTFEASHRWKKEDEGRPWLGIVPIHINPGSSDENDKHDLSHHYLEYSDHGTIKMTAPTTPGEYEVRLFADDPYLVGDGQQQAQAAFVVTDSLLVELDTDRKTYRPSQPIKVTVNNLGKPLQPMVRLLKPKAPHNWINYDFGNYHVYAAGVSGAKGKHEVTIIAPFEPGFYEVRLTDKQTDGPRKTIHKSITSRWIYVNPQSKGKPIDLSGKWVGIYRNSGPNGESVTELIEIKQTGDDIVATKITGDAFVPAGKVTFKANLLSGKGKGHVASKGYANPHDVDGSIKVYSSDSVTFSWQTWSTIEYRRADDQLAKQLIDAAKKNKP